MRIVMIGDVGWRSFYHLGDEAMTECALEAVRERGASHITLIAGDPEHAAELYGVDTVARIGFTPSRPRNRKRAEAVLAAASGDSAALPADDSAHAVIDAVRRADAVLIAGGGNLNSMFAHHLHERWTLAKLADLFHRPYALTSQTVGPLIYDEDRPLLSELFSRAALVGCREAATARLVTEISSGAAPVVRQMDDAFSLAPAEADRAAIADLAREPFAIASFAEKGSSPTLSDGEYRAHLVALTRAVAERTGRRVLLTPHGGALPPARHTRDQLTDAAIAQAAEDDRVTPARMLTARQLVALTERADLVMGTRYHAGIFAAAAGVPYLALAPNLYSSVRMRGAAQNVGMEEFVLPIGEVAAAADTAAGLADGTAPVRGGLTRIGAIRRAEHLRWWDVLVAALRNGHEESTPHAEVDVIPNPFVPEPALLACQLDSIEDLGRVHAALSRRIAILEKSLGTARGRIETLEEQLHDSRDGFLLRELVERVRVLEEEPTVPDRLSRSARRVGRATVRAAGAARRWLPGPRAR